jgi:hypothetical protein
MYNVHYSNLQTIFFRNKKNVNIFGRNLCHFIQTIKIILLKLIANTKAAIKYGEITYVACYGSILGGGAHIIIIYFDNIFYLFLIFNRLSSNPYLLFFMSFMKLEHASFHRDTRLITIYSRSVFIYFDNINNL